MDFTNLSPSITTLPQQLRNYKIQADNPIDGYLTKNGKQAKHTVIMIHQWWGFNESITKTSQILSNTNIRVFVPDLYRGKPALNAEEAQHKMSHLNWQGALKDIANIKKHFQNTSKSVSVVGFCMGGALALASLCSIQGWKAGGVFYGIPDLKVFKLSNIDCKVQCFFGKNDPLKGFSDVEAAESLANEALKNKYPLTVKIWDGAGHAFCNQDSKYFNAKTRDDSFVIIRNLIEEELGK